MLEKSKSLKEENETNFSLDEMTKKFKSILEPKVKIPEYTNLVLPSLFKI
jgi:hypothetical protein